MKRNPNANKKRKFERGEDSLFFIALGKRVIERDVRTPLFFYLRKGRIEKMKIYLQSGACAIRWTCANLNKKGCKPLPKEGEHCVWCNMYKRKRKNKKITECQ